MMTLRATVWIFLACLFLNVVEANNNSKKPPSATNISKKLNRQVEDLYAKAEKLQDRAFQRVYELQEKAQQLQDKAFQRANELEQQSQQIMERATRQAKDLQNEASRNLGELQSTIEGLPIPDLKQNVVVEEEESADVEIDVGEGLSVEVPIVEELVTEVPPTTVVVKNKWQNVRERTLPAVVMLGGLAAYVKFGGSFIPLVFLIQLGLYAETTSVANIHNTITKWWWFATAVAATNGHFLGWKFVDAIAYGMGVTGLVGWVIQQNAAKGGALDFQSHLATLAATALSLVSVKSVDEDLS